MNVKNLISLVFVVNGANAVVVKSAHDNCVAAGVPAKIIKNRIEIEKYIKFYLQGRS